MSRDERVCMTRSVCGRFQHTCRFTSMILANGMAKWQMGPLSAFDSIFKLWPKSACEMHLREHSVFAPQSRFPA